MHIYDKNVPEQISFAFQLDVLYEQDLHHLHYSL